MKYTQTVFNSLSGEDKEYILDQLYLALKYKNLDNSYNSVLPRGEHSLSCINKISNILSKNGYEIEQLT